MTKILILNGPGLPATPSDEIVNAAARAGVTIEYFQSDISDSLFAQMNTTDADAIIFNPAKDITASADLYGQTVAAMSTATKPLTEVHLTNIYAADTAPHSERQSTKTTGIICGLGDLGYVLAINNFAEKLGA